MFEWKKLKKRLTFHPCWKIAHFDVSCEPRSQFFQLACACHISPHKQLAKLASSWLFNIKRHSILIPSGLLPLSSLLQDLHAISCLGKQANMLACLLSPFLFPLLMLIVWRLTLVRFGILRIDPRSSLPCNVLRLRNGLPMAVCYGMKSMSLLKMIFCI